MYGRGWRDPRGELTNLPFHEGPGISPGSWSLGLGLTVAFAFERLARFPDLTKLLPNVGGDRFHIGEAMDLVPAGRSMRPFLPASDLCRPPLTDFVSVSRYAVGSFPVPGSVTFRASIGSVTPILPASSFLR